MIYEYAMATGKRINRREEAPAVVKKAVIITDADDLQLHLAEISSDRPVTRGNMPPPTFDDCQ